ncbi:MAG: flagellar hook-associated protein FlgL, partial [Spirochaetota bacterium]
MYRVTQNMMANNLVQAEQNNSFKMMKLQNDISTGKKHRIPREAPVEVGHSMGYKRAIYELQQFEKNIKDGKARINAAEGALESATTILQRIRELGVQGANGVYTAEDRKKMAHEVEELLGELVETANTKFNGRAVFGGNDT